jgi:amino acid adenylation domain-containing protein/non-ribosomal peptide synthase protein (TIGR01720 family)
VPLDPAYPQERLAFMLENSQVRVLLSQQRHLAGLPRYKTKVVCLDTEWESIAKESKQNPVSAITAKNLAYVIYTSGSTGYPKGVMISHQGLVHYVGWCSEHYEVAAGARVPVHSSLAFDLTVTGLFVPLVVGCSVLLIPEDKGVEELANVLRRGHDFSLVKMTPTHLDMLNQSLAAEELPSTMRMLILGGEALRGESLTNWHLHAPETRFINEYGPTETTVGCCIYEVPHEDVVRENVPIGRPISNTQIYLLDLQLQPVPVGIVGELFIGGMGLARGYLNRLELTAEKFIPHPFSTTPGERLYKTGDLARYLPDGTIEFVGRFDQQVKLRGYRIELGEIEAVLSQHPAVHETIVLISQEEGTDDKRLVAYILPEQAEQKPSQGELRTFLQRKLPEYMVPSAFAVLEAWPLTPNGKIDRRALPAPGRARPQLEHAFEEPVTLTEQLLVGIWSQVLGVDKVGVHDNFFELGGDSIIGLRMVARANEIGLRFTPRQLFEYQTIAQLAAEADLVSTRQTEQDIVTGPVPLTPIQHWFFEQQLPDVHYWNQAVLLEVQDELDPELLEQAQQALLVHHDALRLRFQQVRQHWQQINHSPDEQIPLTIVDLTEVPEAEQRSAIEEAAAQLHGSLNITEGPLMRVALLHLGAPKTSRLLIVIHHLAVDIVSWQILLEDLEIAYQQLRSGQAIQLPSKTTSFKQWAEQQEKYARSAQLRKEVEYWLARPWTSIGRLPTDRPEGMNTRASTRAVLVSLSVEETQALLQQVPKIYHTQINDVLLTALALAYARWTGRRSLLIDLEGHGREDIVEGIDLSRTVGWFTALVPVVLDLGNTNGLGEALKAVKEQLRSIPHGGIGYGVLRYLSKDENIVEQIRLLPRSEVIFNYEGRSAQALSQDALFRFAPESSGPALSPQGTRSHLLDVNVAVEGSRLHVHWTYSENLHRRSTIERLAKMYMEALQSLIYHCQSPEAGGYTPSDFPDTDLSQEELDMLIAKFSVSQEER